MKIVILGAGDHGRVIRDIASYHNNLNLVGFIDDKKEFIGKEIDGLKVLGSFSDLKDLINEERIEGIFLGIGNNKLRASFYERYKNLGLKLPNLFHPSAIISKNVKFGEGVIVMEGVIIKTGTYIGNNVCLNTGCQLDHYNYIDDHSHIYPGAILAGAVKVGKYSYVGPGAVIGQYFTIGNNSFVGMGSVVTKNVPDNVTSYGSPAKIIRKNS